MRHIERAAHDLVDAWSGFSWFQAVVVDEKNNKLFVYCKNRPPKHIRQKQFRTIPLKWKIIGPIRFA